MTELRKPLLSGKQRMKSRLRGGTVAARCVQKAQRDIGDVLVIFASSSKIQCSSDSDSRLHLYTGLPALRLIFKRHK